MLASAGIAHRLEQSGDRWELVVAEEEAARAREVIEAFEAEEAARTPTVASAGRPVPWFLGVAAGALLVAGFAVTGTPASGSRWFERGAAVAGSMLAEPWRAVTALTLHVDAAHVVGNAVATAVLLPPIAARLGGGLALVLTLLAGAGGNVLAALAHAPDHAAVGASTATFAAVGMLGALRLLAGAPGERTRWKSWTVPAASLLLLAILGTGRGADVLAHATGFLSGAAVGLLVAPIRRPLPPLAQWALGALAILTIVACWLRALA